MLINLLPKTKPDAVRLTFIEQDFLQRLILTQTIPPRIHDLANSKQSCQGSFEQIQSKSGLKCPGSCSKHLNKGARVAGCWSPSGWVRQSEHSSVTGEYGKWQSSARPHSYWEKPLRSPSHTPYSPHIHAQILESVWRKRCPNLPVF